MKYLLIFFATILISCSGSSQENIKHPADSQKSSSGGSCLADIEDPKKWYATSEIATIAGVSEENIRQNSKTGNLNMLTFRWDVDRGIVKWNDISITIKNLDKAIKKDSERYNREFTYEEYFDAYHGIVTEEDKKKIGAEVDKKAEEDKNVDADKAKNIISLLDQDQKELNGLGDRAHYSVFDAVIKKGVELVVLHKNVVLTVQVEMHDDDQKDLEVARKITEDLLVMCD